MIKDWTQKIMIILWRKSVSKMIFNYSHEKFVIKGKINDFTEMKLKWNLKWQYSVLV